MASAARRLAKSDPNLRVVYDRFGTPPMWRRPATFATFVRIILEQQVSLASAQSTFNKLKTACNDRVNAKRIRELGQNGLRSLGFSHQKARYSISLAEDVASRRFVVSSLGELRDEDARRSITSRLGLGEWSADVFLMMALMRPDVFPSGDLALVKGMSSLDGCDYQTPEQIVERAESWRPFRSVAARMIWQSYLSKDQ